MDRTNDSVSIEFGNRTKESRTIQFICNIIAIAKTIRNYLRRLQLEVCAIEHWSASNFGANLNRIYPIHPHATHLNAYSTLDHKLMWMFDSFALRSRLCFTIESFVLKLMQNWMYYTYHNHFNLLVSWCWLMHSTLHWTLQSKRKRKNRMEWETFCLMRLDYGWK